MFLNFTTPRYAFLFLNSEIYIVHDINYEWSRSVNFPLRMFCMRYKHVFFQHKHHLHSELIIMCLCFRFVFVGIESWQARHRKFLILFGTRKSQMHTRIFYLQPVLPPSLPLLPTSSKTGIQICKNIAHLYTQRTQCTLIYL